MKALLLLAFGAYYTIEMWPWSFAGVGYLSWFVLAITGYHCTKTSK